MAQLVARLVRNEKVGGSNPPSSTTSKVCPARKLAGQTSFLAGGAEVISLTWGRCWSAEMRGFARICGDLTAWQHDVADVRRGTRDFCLR